MVQVITIIENIDTEISSYALYFLTFSSIRHHHHHHHQIIIYFLFFLSFLFLLIIVKYQRIDFVTQVDPITNIYHQFKAIYLMKHSKELKHLL